MVLHASQKSITAVEPNLVFPEDTALRPHVLARGDVELTQLSVCTWAELKAYSIWVKDPRGLKVVRENEYGPSSLVRAPPLTKTPLIACSCHFGGFAAAITAAAAANRTSNKPG